MDITVSKMIEDFEDRIRILDLRRNINHPGRQPEFPMIVVLLGEEAMKGYLDISSRLFQLWPSYQNVLCFVGITGTAEHIEYYNLSQKNGKMECGSLREEEAQTLADSLTDKKNNFYNRTRKLAYFVLNTAELTDDSDYDAWIRLYLKVKDVLDLSSEPELFVFMLDEKSRIRKEIAKKVRNFIADENCAASQALLLSNRDSGNATTDDWTSCYEIIANVIALTNNRDTRISNVLFQKGIYTVSYVSEKKPIKEIGWVVATKMIEHLIQLQGSATENNPFYDPNIQSRLGISRNQTLKILDSYAEQNLFQKLPDEEQLHLFPRVDDTPYEDIIPCSAKEFNAVTMNTWQCYLDRIMKEAKEKIESNLLLTEKWAGEYEEYLKDTFSADELIVLGDNLEKVSSMFKNRDQMTVSGDIIGSAQQEIKDDLSSDQMILDTFINVVKKCGADAKKSFDIWEQLIESMRQIPPVYDQTITNFYGRRIKNYFDRKEKELTNELKEITDIDKLHRFLKKTIDGIIDSDSGVFLATFDQERAERLRMEENFGDTNSGIQRNLTDNEKMQKYLNIAFAYNAPLISAIMLKFGTSLEDYLRRNMKGSHYYYNTGSSSSAEIIEIYQVERYNLISD